MSCTGITPTFLEWISTLPPLPPPIVNLSLLRVVAWVWMIGSLVTVGIISSWIGMISSWVGMIVAWVRDGWFLGYCRDDWSVS